MSEFSCSNCNYTSDTKKSVKRHIEIKCKAAEIIEIPVDINCEYCDKTFSTRPSLKRHLKTCKIRKANLEEELAQKDEKIKELESKLANKSDKP